MDEIIFTWNQFNFNIAIISGTKVTLGIIILPYWHRVLMNFLNHSGHYCMVAHICVTCMALLHVHTDQ